MRYIKYKTFFLASVIIFILTYLNNNVYADDPEQVIFIIDNSGSMQEYKSEVEKFIQLYQELKELMGVQVQEHLVKFDSVAEEVTSENQDFPTAFEEVMNEDWSGDTDIDTVTQFVIEDMALSRDCTVIMLSDLEDTVFTSNNEGEKATISLNAFSFFFIDVDKQSIEVDQFEGNLIYDEYNGQGEVYYYLLSALASIGGYDVYKEEVELTCNSFVFSFLPDVSKTDYETIYNQEYVQIHYEEDGPFIGVKASELGEVLGLSFQESDTFFFVKDAGISLEISRKQAKESSWKNVIVEPKIEGLNQDIDVELIYTVSDRNGEYIWSEKKVFLNEQGSDNETKLENSDTSYNLLDFDVNTPGEYFLVVDLFFEVLSGDKVIPFHFTKNLEIKVVNKSPINLSKEKNIFVETSTEQVVLGEYIVDAEKDRIYFEIENKDTISEKLKVSLDNNMLIVEPIKNGIFEKEVLKEKVKVLYYDQYSVNNKKELIFVVSYHDYYSMKIVYASVLISIILFIIIFRNFVRGRRHI